ncbi:MAG: DUF4203 domain-containing protein [Planctomycetota bacterium]
MYGFEVRTVLEPELVARAYLTLCVLAGVILCFWGHRAFRPALGLFGALVGGYAAAAGGLYVSEGNHAVALFCGAIGAALGCVLMITAYLLGVFVIGAALGGMLGAVFTIQAPADLRLVVVAVLAALGGVLGLFLERFIIIAATALNGAALVVGGLWMLASGVSPAEAYGKYLAAAGEPVALGAEFGGYKYLLLAAWAALGCLGTWIQLSVKKENANDE